MEGDIASHLFHQLLVITSPSPFRRDDGKCSHRPGGKPEQTRSIAPEYQCRYPGSALQSDFVITERPFRPECRCCRLGELNRVAHQIGNDLLQAQRVANDVIRHIILILSVSSSPLSCDEWARSVTTSSSSCAAGRDTLQNQLARFQLREVQYVVNNGQQVIG